MAEQLIIDVAAEYPPFSLRVDEAIDLTGITAVFGASGAGKSTLLRMIAGLDVPTAGRIALGPTVLFDAETATQLPTHQRPVGYVFQDARLFGHLDVGGNLRFAEKRRTGSRGGASMDEIVEACATAHLLDRQTTTLSGGERQRVALARALLGHPELLLLDEPLSAVDRPARREILPFLAALPARFGVPCIYVSHDIDEVAYIADRVLVLAEGAVVQHGATADVIGDDRLDEVIGSFEAGSILDGTVSRSDARLCLTYVTVGETTLSVPTTEALTTGQQVRLRVRARDVALATRRPDDISIRNIASGTIANIDERPGSAFAEIGIKFEGGRLRARVTRATVEDLSLAVDMPIFALIKSVGLDGLLA